MTLRLTAVVLAGLIVTACAAETSGTDSSQDNKQSIYNCTDDAASATRQVIAESAAEAERLCLSPAGGSGRSSGLAGRQVSAQSDARPAGAFVVTGSTFRT
jgi:hypothetical protein